MTRPRTTRALLLQLPIPRLNYGRRTGNIPLGAACLKQAAVGIPGVQVDLLPESAASYLGDSALIEVLVDRAPDLVGFSVFSWNLERSLYAAASLKQACGARIVFGGPEIAPDIGAGRGREVDFFACGEGEVLFRRLLTDPGFWDRRSASMSASGVFRSAPSPYLDGLLEPQLENLMLLETQRGCPYRCGFCRYNKARRGLVFADESLLLRAAAWAVGQGIGEVYLLDPSLNTRPRLKPLLAGLARLNAAGGTSFFSEIRAEAVDGELADLFAAAGFNWFEVGLQSTNPGALKIMNRETDLKRFLRGAQLLKERGITPSVDLIIGLPGDDLAGFMRSVDFVADHGLQEDVQIFPLAVLPGTEFRARSSQLGLRYEPHPPYTVVETATFSREDFLLAYDYAESRFDTVFFPLPDLDVSWRVDRARGFRQAADVWVRLGEGSFLAKLLLNRRRPLRDIRRLARRLTHPYQVLVGPGAGDIDYLREVLGDVSAANPFTPLEVVFFEPRAAPPAKQLLAAVKLKRPHFLDGDLRFLGARPGNRAVLFTLVSQDPDPRFQGDMQRQVYWWQRSALPALDELNAFAGLDGVLIDPPATAREIAEWQDGAGREAAEMHHISFSDVHLQRRWLLRASPGEYAERAMAWETVRG
jgi:hypothetical protein